MTTEPMFATLAAPAVVQPACILAIDPGSSQSAWVVLNPATWGLRSFAKVPNEQLLEQLRGGLSPDVGAVVIEQIEPRFGVNIGQETLETARWAGVFEEAARPVPVARLQRSVVLAHIGIVTRGPNRTTADAGVRAALIDRYGGIRGKAAAIGLKATPGPLYGLHADCWAALAVAIAHAEGAKPRERK